MRRDLPRYAALIGALAVVAGCAVVEPAGERPLAEANPTSAASVTERPIWLRDGAIRGTVTIPAGAAAASRRGVVVNPVTDAAALVERGMVVARYQLHWPSLLADPGPPRVAPAPDAAQTVGVWLLASPSPKVIGRTYFELIWAEGTAARSVVDHLASLDFVAADRIGLAGISTNGFKVYSALLAGVPLRAAVIVGACGDYHAFLRDSPVALAGAELDLDPEYESWLREREPIRHADRLVTAALLLVNGGRDHVIPSACVEGAATAMREAYTRHGVPERFHQSWLPEATHNDLVRVAAPEIVAWWEKWLGT
jgi:hypothetical protein